jgi:cytochrome c oxidase subunit 1
MLPFVWNVWKSYRFGRATLVDDPWGHGMSLEWATSCPPPLRNFDRMPRIRSERPAFDLHFPEQGPGRPAPHPSGSSNGSDGPRTGASRKTWG